MKTHGGDSLLRTPAVEMEKWGHTSHVEISVVIAANSSSDWLRDLVRLQSLN